MKPTSIHLLWAVVAAGAFAGGMFWQKSQAPAATKLVTVATQAAAISDKKTDPAAAASALPESLTKIQEFMQRFANADGSPLSPEQMKAAMKEILTESDPVKSSLMFAMMLDQLSPENAPAVLAEIRARVAGFEGMRYYGLLSYKWGAVDGAGAMAEAATQDGPAKMMTSIAAIAGWATKDPAAAQAWLASNQSGNEWEKSAMERGLVNGLARTNPAAAEAYVTAMKDSGERSRMTQVLMEEKMKQGPDAAAAWAASLTDPEMKRGALESIADQLSRSDPAKGIELIKANAADPSSANAAGTLARRLADKDIKQGLSFAQDLPAGAVRNEAFTQAYSSYAGKDSAEAAETINLMANGADRDAAVRGLAPRMAREEPQAARTWAESITDPDVQLQTMQDVLRSTARSDREGTIAYMTEKGWTQEQQDTILNAPNDGPGRGGFGGPGGGGFGGPRRNR